MTLDDLEKIYGDAYWTRPELEPDGARRAGIIAVVRALRDETAVSSCACRFWLDDILAPREGGSREAGASARKGEAASDLRTEVARTPAAPAPDVFFSKEPPVWAQDPFNPGMTATCGSCGAWMSVVRPGKHQCDNPNCPTEAQR